MATKFSAASCCRLEGKLFTGVRLERIFERSSDCQSDSSYHVPAGQSLKEEIARAYRIASSAYFQFKRAYEHQSYSAEVKLEATHHFARALFTAALGYNQPRIVESIAVDAGHGANHHVVTFPVTMLLDQGEVAAPKMAQTTNITPLTGSDGQQVSALIPLTVVYAAPDKNGQRSTLDSVLDACAITDSASPKKLGKRSPFALTQELLNMSADYLWGLAFNGFSLRLLRDVLSFARPSFVEFDLEAMFEGDNQAEFSHLYLLLHSSRARVDPITGLNVWEQWLKLCAQEGIPAREQLSASMQEAMECLGTGFLRAKGKGNDALRAKIASQKLSTSDYNHQLMRLMYRFLFVFCLEERDIIHTRYTEQTLQQDITALQAHELKAKLSARTHLPDNQPADDVTDDILSAEWGAQQLSLEPLYQNNKLTGGGYASSKLTYKQRVQQHHACAIQLYDEGYSLRRLRERCLLQRLYTQHHDIWLSIKVVFTALAAGEERLALPALGGLFNPDQCPDLMADEVNLTNEDVLKALKLMRWATLQDVFTLIDYRNIETQELGSLYEGLLELVPTITYLDPLDRFTFSFEFDQGNANERKSTGSYYTPDSLVKSLITTALDPVIEQKLKDNPEDPESALLSLKVIDPACGSGHFLMAAAHHITARIMEQKAFIAGAEEVAYRQTMHDVIAHCIYGVDINPMALELTRMALWLEGAAENLPLSFIDHHLKVGNSLLGVMNLDALKHGISSEAYKPQVPLNTGLTCSDKAVCAALKKRNNAERKIFAQNQLDTGLNSLENLGQVMAHLGYVNLDQLSADTLQAEARKAQQNEQNQRAKAQTPEYQACNLLLAAFLSKKTNETAALVPTTKDIDLLLTDPQSFDSAKLQHAHKVCAENQVLHWPFEFMEVMAQGGFDCVIGNPPWEKFKVEDVKWFAPHLPQVAQAKTAAIRKKMIEELAAHGTEQERQILSDYLSAQYQAAAFSTINHLSADEGGRFPLTGVGDTNLFAYFAELALALKAASGAVGIVVPAGILTDDTTKLFSREIFSTGLVRSVYHFNNSEGLFADVAGNYSFALLTLQDSSEDKQADCVFYATRAEQLEDTKRHIHFEPRDLALINPNTQTAILVRSEYDLQLCRKLYNAAPVLIRYGADNGNPWQVQSMAMFHMSNDSALFNELTQEEATAAHDFLPLYEGKLFWQFDHRFASFNYDAQGKITNVQLVEQERKQNQAFTMTPRYWVKTAEVQSRWRQKNWQHGWTLAVRSIARSTDERTIVTSVLPTKAGAGDTVTLLMPQVSDQQAACLLALLNSLVVDFVERIKQAGVHASLFYLKQLPILPPEAFAPEDVAFIASRVAQLTRTADDINAVWLTDYPAYSFQEPRKRLQIRAELDAYIAKMYGLTREELQYILDPATVMGPEHPSVTFPGLKRKETELYGEYLTERLVLAAYDALSAGTLK